MAREHGTLGKMSSRRMVGAARAWSRLTREPAHTPSYKAASLKSCGWKIHDGVDANSRATALEESFLLVCAVDLKLFVAVFQDKWLQL